MNIKMLYQVVIISLALSIVSSQGALELNLLKNGERVNIKKYLVILISLKLIVLKLVQCARTPINTARNGQQAVNVP